MTLCSAPSTSSERKAAVGMPASRMICDKGWHGTRTWLAPWACAHLCLKLLDMTAASPLTAEPCEEKLT